MTLIDTIPIYRPSTIAFYAMLGLVIIALFFDFYKNGKHILIAFIAVAAMFIHTILLIGGVYDVHCGDRYVVILDENVPASFFNDYTLVKHYEYSDAILVEKKER